MTQYQLYTQWLNQLYTVMGGANSVMIRVRLDATSNGATLPAREVVIHIFNCPAWGIGAETITVRYSATFPNFFGVLDSPGSVSLTTNIQNCDSLTRVSIPLQPINDVVPIYFLVFHNPSGAVIQWVHIGEVMFSDQPIAVPTTMATTTTATTLPTSVAETTVNGMKIKLKSSSFYLLLIYIFVEFSTSTATPLVSTMSAPSPHALSKQPSLSRSSYNYTCLTFYSRFNKGYLIPTTIPTSRP